MIEAFVRYVCSAPGCGRTVEQPRRGGFGMPEPDPPKGWVFRNVFEAGVGYHEYMWCPECVAAVPGLAAYEAECRTIDEVYRRTERALWRAKEARLEQMRAADPLAAHMQAADAARKTA